jgi:hypothetical protein
MVRVVQAPSFILPRATGGGMHALDCVEER